jgi:uncharacterized oligopeptide transporter (OPT) family protein
LSDRESKQTGEPDFPPFTNVTNDSPDPAAIAGMDEPVAKEMHSLVDIGQMSEQEWYEKVYQGDDVPQLTVRAVLMGAALGSVMAISNLYTSIKIGWAFGVAITSCVLSFVIWNGLRVVFRRLTPMSILENNCMQSTASAAGYSTGSTVGTAFGALFLITGHHTDPKILMPWVFFTAVLGVFLAVPMKRQMVNREKLPFPSGIAAAETLRSLYGKSRAAILQAYSLVCALSVGLVTGLLRVGDFAWQKVSGLKLPDMIIFPLRLNGFDISNFPQFGIEPGVLMIGAGMLIGPRVSLSMLFGSAVLYLWVGPQIVGIHEIEGPEKLMKWSLWTGTSLMVTATLTALLLQWKTVMKAFTSLSTKDSGTNGPDPLARLEVPSKWLLYGGIPAGIAMVILQYCAFSISIPLGILSVVMSFFLALVACRSTGETDITPISAMGKITQLVYAVLAKSSTVTNLMTGSVTANIAISSADLLTDLKSGYLLGANPRRQFLAQLIGVFFGTAAIVPAWYFMMPTKEIFEKYNPPSANLWKAVAEALTHGFSAIYPLAREGMIVGAILGILVAVAEHYTPKQYKRFVPSSMGLGLSWVVWFSNSMGFAAGAVIAWLWGRLHKKSADLFVVPVASGAIAGESLMCAMIAMYMAAKALGGLH